MGTGLAADARAIRWAPVNAFLLQFLDAIGPYGDLLATAEERVPADLRPGVEALLKPRPDIAATNVMARYN